MVLMLKKRLFLLVFALTMSSLIFNVQGTSELSNYALSFDGDNDYVDFGDVLDFEGTSPFTLLAWINPKGLPETFGQIFCKLASPVAGWEFFYHSSEILGMMRWADNVNHSTCVSNTSLSLNTWHHVVTIYNGTQLSIYMNGTLDSSIIPDSFSIPNTTEILAIGQRSSFLNELFNGTFDDMQIYDRAISEAEISYIFNAGVGRYAPLNMTGLVSWLKFDEGSGNILYDKSGNDNHGTIQGATWTTGIGTDWYNVNQENLSIQTNYLGTLSDVSFSSGTLVLDVDGASETTSTTKIYCRTLGEPKKIEGADDWTWDPSGYITIYVTHQSSRTISVSWSGGALGLFNLRVRVSSNMIPIMGASVIIDGENKSTDLLGDAYFQVPFGSYDVLVFCGDKNETRSISVSGDLSVGFDFNVPIERDRGIFIIIGLPIGLIILVFVGIFLWRKK